MAIKNTISSIFMVPTLKINRERLREFNFINAYCKDIKLDTQYENCIYLLFKPEDIDKFALFIDSEYDRTNSIVDDYEYTEGYVVLVYKLNPKFNKDFQLVREGKYSKVSDDFKNMFLKQIKVIKKGQPKEEISLQWKIFTKSEDLKNYWENKIGIDFKEEMEVWRTWQEEKEVMNIDEIIKEYEKET